MYTIRFSPGTQDFKIRSKADVKFFLEKMFTGGDALKVAPDHAYIIRVTHGRLFDQDETNVEVCVKYGDLYNQFNPIIQLDESEYLSQLWKYRKIMNERYLGE